MGSLTSREETPAELATFQYGVQLLYGSPDLKTDPKARARVAIAATQLDPELHAFLQQLPIFNLPEAELTSSGFSRCVDYPELPQHVYYEGYFHSYPASGPGPYFSFNPRNGLDFEKPAAPVELRAFYAAIRQVNQPLLQDIVSNLEQLAGSHPACAMAAQLFKDQHHFSDLAIQVHYGSEVKDENLGWHVDTINSILHCAVAISGRRALHSRWLEVAQVQAGEKGTEHVHWQEPGAVYVSAPAFFGHSVEYIETPSYAERIIAIQARFAFPYETLSKWRVTRDADGKGWVLLSKIIASAIQRHSLVLPTLAQVRVILEELEKQDAAYMEMHPVPPPAQPPRRDVECSVNQ
eukprot:TRINITY_DN2873_c0_g1_i2.p1 TRINITY_DN2873_c0_g1~~TRINITY_DN2873_c0_g1_i2.p1  ORF type:complete len:351 (-),score=36.04 TRINITY_DN2873_c0_g1_i2:42-1094(-)